MRVIANKSILHNNVTNCTFIACEMDEKVQTGTRENDSHIEWMGDLNRPIVQTDDLETCTSCEVKFIFEDNKDGEDGDNNYFCRSCWGELEKVMAEEYKILKETGQLD